MRKSPLRRSAAVFFLLAVTLIVPLTRSQAQNGGDGASDVAGRMPLLPSATRSTLPDRQARQPRDVWVPPDIDGTVPSLMSSQPCSLPRVLARAGRRVQELVSNLDRFTATEFVEHQRVNRSGKLDRAEDRKFDYLVSVGRTRGGYLDFREYRSLPKQSARFPDQIATEGTPSLVLVFHPKYAPDFEMKCEGLGRWQGQPAWQVRFEQRSDRPNHLSAVRIKNKQYAVRLRGRAWILANSYQVAHLETDLAETIPAIKMRLDHMSVDYRPVAFPARHTQLWLPVSAELYLDFAGRRFYRKHSFTDFTLFSVDVNQQIADPPDLDVFP
jgi:hypothetical protein